MSERNWTPYPHGNDNVRPAQVEFAWVDPTGGMHPLDEYVTIVHPRDELHPRERSHRMSAAFNTQMWGDS